MVFFCLDYREEKVGVANQCLIIQPLSIPYNVF